MTITVIEALTLLNSSDYKTPSALQQLAMDLSVEANGKVTVLYGQSIDVGGVSPENTGTLLKTAAIAEQLANDPDVRIIDKTAFAKIVSSQAFERAVAEAHGCTWDQFKDFKNPTQALKSKPPAISSTMQRTAFGPKALNASLWKQKVRSRLYHSMPIQREL